MEDQFFKNDFTLPQKEPPFLKKNILACAIKKCFLAPVTRTHPMKIKLLLALC